jgi:quercetin dioxygenase-like cupin family protein
MSQQQTKMAELQKGDIPPGVLNEKRRTIYNKMNNESITFTKYSYETNGDFTEMLIGVAPGGGPPPHYHNTYGEKFEAIDGELVVVIGESREHKKIGPGESAWVPMGTQHRFTNEGEGWVQAKASMIPASPGFERALYIVFGLAEDDLVVQGGLPKSLVQTAIISSMSDMRFPGISGWFLNSVVDVLAWYGKWSGEEERLLQKYWH